MEEKISLNNSEWEIMECLWENSPKTIVQMVKEMKEKKDWAKSTTNTMIRRMEAKGLIFYEQGEKARLYYPKIKREEIAANEAQTLLHKVFHGQIGLMLSALVPQNNLTDEDIRELEDILHKTGGK